MLQTVQGGGLDIEEPDWLMLIPNQKGDRVNKNKRWRDYAHQEWLRITAEMRETNTLSPVNRHTIQRLVLACIRYDRASIEVFRGGTIGSAPTSETATLQIYHSEMRQADADATTAERELGLTPLRRGNTKQVKRAEKVQRKSDRYLSQSVPG